MPRFQRRSEKWEPDGARGRGGIRTRAIDRKDGYVHGTTTGLSTHGLRGGISVLPMRQGIEKTRVSFRLFVRVRLSRVYVT